jgi:predicted dehydrogenase
MADSVGIAVVGTGDWGANLARNYADLPGGRLVALHDNDAQRLKKSAAQYPAARAVASLGDLAAAPASLEQGGTPARLAPAGQETS